MNNNFDNSSRTDFSNKDKIDTCTYLARMTNFPSLEGSMVVVIFRLYKPSNDKELCIKIYRNNQILKLAYIEYWNKYNYVLGISKYN